MYILKIAHPFFNSAVRNHISHQKNTVMKKILLLLIPMIVITVSSYSFNNNIVITGIITNDKGLPMEAITVGVAGTASVAVTDAKGKYQLANVPETAIPNFMGFGLRTAQEKVNSRTVINVVLYSAVTVMPAVATAPASQKEDVAVPAKARTLKAKINLLLSLGEEFVRTASLVKTIKAELKSPAKPVKPIAPVIKTKVNGEDDEEEEEDIKKRTAN